MHLLGKTSVPGPGGHNTWFVLGVEHRAVLFIVLLFTDGNKEPRSTSLETGAGDDCRETCRSTPCSEEWMVSSRATKLKRSQLPPMAHLDRDKNKSSPLDLQMQTAFLEGRTVGESQQTPTRRRVVTMCSKASNKALQCIEQHDYSQYHFLPIGEAGIDWIG